jgi:hypothetical protein
MSRSGTLEDLATRKSRSRVAWRHVILFTMLAYGIAWALWAAVVPDLGGLLTAARTPEELKAPFVAMLGMIAPMLAAVVMRVFVSKEGLRGSLRPIGRPRYYAIAVVGPMLMVSVVIVVAVATGLGMFTAGPTALWIVYAGLAFNALTYSAFLAMGEEYGWRGYLLPKLLPFGEVKAAVIVGMIWGPWHVPLLLAGLNYPGVNPLAAIAIFVPGAILLSLLSTRLYVAAGGSVLAVAVLHGSFNSFGDTLTGTKHFEGNPLVATPAGMIGLGVLTLAAVVAYHLRRPSTARRRTVTAAPTSREPTPAQRRAVVTAAVDFQ